MCTCIYKRECVGERERGREGGEKEEERDSQNEEVK